LAGARDQALCVSDSATWTCVAGDELLLERTVRNLVDNAIKYGPAGRPITIVLRDGPGNTVELRVEDEGTPIPPDQRARVFEPHVRLGGAAATSGHGLGLAFCARSAAIHGGAVTVEPRPGGGNAFVLRLPGWRQARAAERQEA
jgi:two-component system sensor histidine kinase KdpD